MDAHKKNIYNLSHYQKCSNNLTNRGFCISEYVDEHNNQSELPQPIFLLNQTENTSQCPLILKASHTNITKKVNQYHNKKCTKDISIIIILFIKKQEQEFKTHVTGHPAGYPDPECPPYL